MIGSHRQGLSAGWGYIWQPALSATTQTYAPFFKMMKQTLPRSPVCRVYFYSSFGLTRLVSPCLIGCWESRGCELLPMDPLYKKIGRFVDIVGAELTQRFFQRSRR